MLVYNTIITEYIVRNQEKIMDVGVTCTVNVTAASRTTGRWLVEYIKINCSFMIVWLISNWLINQGWIKSSGQAVKGAQPAKNIFQG